MEILCTLSKIIAFLFFLCYLHQLVYIPIRWFKKPKTASPSPKHSFAVLICARNEEAVIGQLLDSIRGQTYPADKITVFVMADNCTDGTADIARRHGAAVYERQNTRLIGKGYALEELLLHIGRDYGDIFDGYFVFDADNILRADYIDEMNKCFRSGTENGPTDGRYEILTGYRGAKNFGDNWISAGYGIQFLRESSYLNHPRSLIGVSCAVSGTGFLFSRRILRKIGFWRYHLLTEDIEFTTDQIIDGETIGYCCDAVLYDEQPTRFSQSFRQRMRWSKGYLQVFARYGGRLCRRILSGSFSAWDMLTANIPAIVLNLANLTVSGLIAAIRIENGASAAAFLPILSGLAFAYLTFFLFGAVTVITEWKHIGTSAKKKVLYTFTFPLFMFTYIPISITALFTKVTWKPIEHHALSAIAAGKRADG